MKGGKIVDKKKYKSKMALFGDTNKTTADALGITPQTNSSNLNNTNGADYTRGEIAILKARWNLTAEEIDEIFFDCKVS